MWAVIHKLRAGKYDAAYILTNSLRTAFISWAARIPERIGYVRYSRGVFLTRKLYAPRNGRKLVPISAVDYYQELVGQSGADVNDRTIELGTTPDKDDQSAQLWDRLGLHGSNVVALNTGGAYGGAKRWPDQHFADLATRLVLEHRAKIVIVCGPAERDAANRIAALAGSPHIHSLAGRKAEHWPDKIRDSTMQHVDFYRQRASLFWNSVQRTDDYAFWSNRPPLGKARSSIFRGCFSRNRLRAVCRKNMSAWPSSLHEGLVG